MWRLMLIAILVVPQAAWSQDGEDGEPDDETATDESTSDETEPAGDDGGEPAAEPAVDPEGEAAEGDDETDWGVGPGGAEPSDDDPSAEGESGGGGDPADGTNPAEGEEPPTDDGVDLPDVPRSYDGDEGPEGETYIQRSYYESGPDRDILLPQNIGGLYVVPLPSDEDLDAFVVALEIPKDSAAVLVHGLEGDRFEFDGINLKLPPPLVVFELETGVHVLAITRGAFTHEHRVHCEEGTLSRVDVDKVFASLKSVDELAADNQRDLMLELFSAIGETDDIVDKIRICRRFLEVHPVGDAADKAQAMLADYESKVTHEDEGKIDITEGPGTEELLRQRRLEQFASSPRPPGTRSRQVAGFALLGAALASGAGAAAFDLTAKTAAENYHHELVQGTAATAGPYMEQARQNRTGFRLTLAGAIAAGSTAAIVLIADRAIHARWERLREELNIGADDDAEVMIVPAPMLGDGAIGISVGGVWR